MSDSNITTQQQQSNAPLSLSTPVTESKRHSMSQKTRKTPREIRFGAYVLGSTLGEGEFAKVKLGWRKDGKHPSQAAIKLIKRESIPKGSERENKVFREINALKKLAHPNIVRLEEVLQNEKYIGIVLEYASGGELFDYILEHRYLKDALASKLFAQLVSGVDYMHSKGIIHRDLKLENLLLDKHKNIVISDFGFVNSFHGSNDYMKTSCGSPCYAAPELVVSSDPYEGRKVDVWSCGVILYAMLAGYLPYDDDPQNPDGNNIARLYHYITHTPLTFPEYIEPTPRDLLRKIIVANPKKRLSLKQVRSHPWLAQHAPFLSVTPTEWDNNYRNSKQSRQPINSSHRHQLTQQEKANRRYSLMETPGSSASSMSASFMNKSNIKSYSTHNVAAKLYSNPAAPQTSHAVAVPFPTSASSTNISSHLSPKVVPVSSSSVHDHGNNDHYSSSSEFYQTGHARSGSTASLVLHAVVEADKAEVSRRNSLTNDPFSPSSMSSSSNIVKPTIGNSSRPSDHSRNNSFTSLSNFILPNNNSAHNFSTIVESPEKSSSTNEGKGLGLMLPPTSKSGQPPKLPPSRSHNRPRPTSYHPSSSSSNYQFPSPDLSFLLPQKFHDSSLSVNEPIMEVNESQIHSTKDDLSNIKSNNSSFINLDISISPNKENRKSWCQPKVTEPIVDMSMANGVLTKLNSSSSVGTNQLSKDDKSSINGTSTNNKSENRKSIAMDSLTNAIDLYSISSKSTSNLPSPDVVVPKLVMEEVIKAKEPKSESISPVTANSSPIKEQSPQLFETVLKSTELNKKSQSTLSSKASTSSKKQTISGANVSNAKASTQVNTPTPPISTARHKRFSMLSFYSSSTPSSSNNKAQTSRQSPSATSTPQKKALEPSKEVNIMRDFSNASTNSTYKTNSSRSNGASGTPTSRFQKRMTISGVPTTSSSHHTSASVTNDNGDKESSTAKRVMDFFKRKSIRI